MQNTLVIMVKVPKPGRVKTRLAKDMGLIDATWWFRHQSRALIKRVQDPRWQTVLAVSPDAAGLTSRVWPAHLRRVPQGRGNLGDRMKRVFQTQPRGPVCIIGADIPGITRQRVASGFKALRQTDAVFGPAFDGGYWLIGLKRQIAPPSILFANVRWSTEHALSDTIATLPGHRVNLIEQLRDIDTLQDLKECQAGN